MARSQRASSDGGFALVITISLMVLLALLAVGLLSLSAVTLRSSSNALANSEARANARLALSIALGELQKSMGPDQRVSANGEILAGGESSTVANPHWTGVWDSWRAGPGSPAGGDDPSEHSTIEDPESGIHPSYEEHRKDHFRSWLVSLNPEVRSNLEAARSLSLDASVSPGSDQNAVVLVGEGSLGQESGPEDQVKAPLVSISPGGDPDTAAGHLGWWVGDESQKATIMDDSYQTSKPQSLADRLNRQQAPASMGNSEIKGLEKVIDETPLSFIASRNTLSLVDGTTPPIQQQFHHISTHSMGLLTDVREGGLKRDLSTLLERPVVPEEVYRLGPQRDFERATGLTDEGEDFMLYNFDNMLTSGLGSTGEAAVPIQDLAVYYQLYNRHGAESKGGIQYSSSESSPPNALLNRGIMISNPDYGGTQTDLQNYLRQNTALYRRPVPIKIEVVLSYSAERRTQAEIEEDEKKGIAEPDRYKLRLGISPAITFWNPNNVPLVMNLGNPDRDSEMMREIPIPLKITFNKSDGYSGPVEKIADRQMGQVTSTQQGELYTFFISGNYPVRFEPGESKVFALRYASNTDAASAGIDVDFMLRGRGNNRFSEVFVDELELVPGWNPDRFVRARSDGGARGGGGPIIGTFDADDFISATIQPGQNGGVGVERYSFRTVFHQKSRHGRNAPGVKWHFHSFNIQGRYNNGNDPSFINDVVYRGFPLNGSNVITNPSPRVIEIPAREGQKLIDSIRNPFNPRDDLPLPFFYYALKAPVETHESNNRTGPPDGAGRRFPTRPFTHSTPLAPAFIDRTDPESLYNSGWNWFFMPLDNMADAPVEISLGDSGYHGGGYTAENGVTHVVQQQLPVTPPLSIATLSHAHLGGFSLGTEAASGAGEDFRRTTVLGHGGLAPHTLQAIGNSYAHPNIPPDKAVTTWTRQFEGSTQVNEPFVDHSYLANKALWDEFFFSSISPRPDGVRAFSESRTARQVAEAFFLDAEPLPNPRIVPSGQGIDEDELDRLFDLYEQYRDGFADQIARHLMVEGPFNVNSTSVEAWRALFSSLKGKQISYLDAESALVVGTNLDFEAVDGVPVPGGPLPSGRAYRGSSSVPSDREQWTGFRELTDTEIEELAGAMVEQVKLRGPFLSLSDFVNRRLDGRASAKEFALKGALQAALDDPDVSINEGFRRSPRVFTNRETSFGNAKFPDAMEGPVAYGSAAYVDQADILRSFPAQLTPRGDTFVIRTYGDSVDRAGRIVARAWCEAVVQRLPEYVDPTDEPERRQADLDSDSNRAFGRKLAVVSFRWLNSSEI